MTTGTDDNVIPLIEAATTHRNRLIERARQSNVADSVALNNAVIQIDRWLINFAYEHVIPNYWTTVSR